MDAVDNLNRQHYNICNICNSLLAVKDLCRFRIYVRIFLNYFAYSLGVLKRKDIRSIRHQIKQADLLKVITLNLFLIGNEEIFLWMRFQAVAMTVAVNGILQPGNHHLAFYSNESSKD